MASRMPPSAFASRIRDERKLFAAKLRAARALLGWSQGRFAEEAGITQRAVHKLETCATEPRRGTVLAIETVWANHEISFENTSDGVLRINVPASALDTPSDDKLRDTDRLRIVAGWSVDRS